MRLGNIKFSIQPEELDFKQFAIDTEYQIIVNKNEINNYVVALDLDKVDLKKDTVVALNLGDKKLWTGVLADLDIMRMSENAFTFDFTPVIKTKGFSIPSCRFRKRSYIEPVKEVEKVEPTTMDTEPMVQPQPLIINTEPMTQPQPLIINTEPVKPLTIESKPVQAAPQPVPTGSKTIMIGGVRLNIKSPN